MLFQTIDDKSECIGIYANGNLHFDNFPTDLTHTWKYTGSVIADAEYAWLYGGGQSLLEVCPESLAPDLKAAQRKMAAYQKSFKIAKINLNEHCIFDLVPHDFLTHMCDLKNQIAEHVFNNYERPLNYDHLVEVDKLLHKIRYQRLNLNLDGCKELLYSTGQRTKAQELCRSYLYIDYRLYGTVTGRLTTNKNSFPVLTIAKQFRKLIKPNNDLFVSLDYNGAEIRTLIELSGQEQPQEDIHEWNARNLFSEPLLRKDAKARFFAWLYDPSSTDIETEHYNREKILDKWYVDGYINTPYGRSIEVEQRKAFNYLIQSTTADRVLAKAVLIDRLLKNKKSYISHIMHDEIVIDYSDEERSLIGEIKEIFEDGYMSSVHGGKTYFDLEDLKI